MSSFSLRWLYEQLPHFLHWQWAMQSAAWGSSMPTFHANFISYNFYKNHWPWHAQLKMFLFSNISAIQTRTKHRQRLKLKISQWSSTPPSLIGKSYAMLYHFLIIIHSCILIGQLTSVTWCHVMSLTCHSVVTWSGIMLDHLTLSYTNMCMGNVYCKDMTKDRRRIANCQLNIPRIWKTFTASLGKQFSLI